ncbi:MAG: N-acetyltransferase [Gaiellales bacterium]|nr:N-acetyltransferase [Gaiellales bacterium]
MQRLINSWAKQGMMLPRSLHALYEHLRDYFVIVDDEHIAGCVALHVAWDDLAEVRSMAVSPDRQRHHLGLTLLDAALQEAADLGISRVFVLTYVPDFFARRGFQTVAKTELPQKIWQECIHCIHFPDCDEEAMLLTLPQQEPAVPPLGS